MRGFTAALSLVALAAAVSAADVNVRPVRACPPTQEQCCLTGPIARKLAETWNYFFVNMNPQLALATLTEDFLLFSDSDNIITEGPFVSWGPTYGRWLRTDSDI